jgi:hypothetical protein
MTSVNRLRGPKLRGLMVLMVAVPLLTALVSASPAAAKTKSPPPSSNGWTQQSVPSPGSGDYGDYLSGTSCAGTTCFSVGTVSNSPFQDSEAFVDTQVIGSDTVTTTSVGPVGSSLSGVSCLSVTFCIAVGQTWTSETTSSSLIETWNGNGWTTSGSQSPATGEDATNSLTSVSCVSATSCTAVGGDGWSPDGTNVQQNLLVESLSGGSWTTTYNPTSPLNDLFYFYGVSCPDSEDCVAVGTDNAGPISMADTDGSWSQLSPPGLPSGAPADSVVELSGVSCVSSSECVAVGDYSSLEGLHGDEGNAVYQLVGGAWQVENVPNAVPVVDGNGNEMSGVSCVQATSAGAVSCMAVGNSSAYSPIPTPGILTALQFQPSGAAWPSGSWVSESPMTPAVSNTTPGVSLNSVSCSVATFCAAGGSDGLLPLIETWMTPAYVAVGDSYAAGAIPPLIASSGACQRSEAAYPVAWDPYADSEACSSATTQAVEKHQLGDLTENGTKVVTISAGGDNEGIDLFAIFKKCITKKLTNLGDGGDGEPCKSNKLSAENLNKVKADLVKLYQIVHAKAKAAHIYAIGYPNPLPAAAPSGGCPGLNLFGVLSVVQDEDIAFLHGLIVQLNDTVSAAVTASGVPNITYVGPPAAGAPNTLVGHDMCVTPTDNSAFVPVSGGQGAPGHPDALGQQSIANWLQQVAGAPPE